MPAYTTSGRTYHPPKKRKRKRKKPASAEHIRHVLRPDDRPGPRPTGPSRPGPRSPVRPDDRPTPRPTRPGPRADERQTLPERQRKGLGGGRLPRDIQRRVARGDILSEAAFEDWAAEKGLKSPDHGNYLAFVARRRGLPSADLLEQRAAESELYGPQSERKLERRGKGRGGTALPGRAGAGVSAREVLARNVVEPGEGAQRPSTGGERGRPTAPRPIGRDLGEVVEENDPLGSISHFFTDTIGGRLREELGLSGSPTGRMRLGNETMSILPTAPSSGAPAARLGTAAAAGSARSVVDRTVKAAGLPGLAAEQIAEGLLYSPAFLVEFARDPRGTLRGVYETARYAVEHPTERPGDVVALLWGAGGGLLGAAGRLGRLRSGGVGAALRPGPSTRAVPEGVRDAVPGARGRRAVRDRRLVSELRAADAAALRRVHDRPVVETVTAAEIRDLTGGRSSKARSRGNAKEFTLVVQDEAIRAVFDQTTPRERLAFFERQLEQTANQRTRKRLERRANANRVVISRGLVEGEPGSVRVAAGHERLAELAEATRRVSDEQAGEKALLGLVSEEGQELHLYDPGAIVRGQERVPGEPYHLATPEFPGEEQLRPTLATVESLEHDLAQREAGAARAREKLEPGPEREMSLEEVATRKRRVDRELAPLLDLIEEAAVKDIYGRREAMRAEQARLNRQSAASRARQTGTRARVDARVAQLLKQVRASDDPHPQLVRMRGLLDEQDRLNDVLLRNQPDPLGVNEGLARAEMPTTRDEPTGAQRRRLEERVAANERRAGQVREAIAEAEPFLPRPERLVPGQTYGPYKVDLLGKPPVLSPRVRRLIGRTQRPAVHRMTGEALRSAKYGSVVKLTAQEALELARYRERLELWKEAVAKSKSGADVLEELAAGRSTLEDWLVVRVKPGASTAATARMDRFATDPNNPRVVDARVVDVFGHLSEEAQARFAELAADADASGQIRFVHKDVGVEPLRLTPHGFIRSTAGLVNQLARFVTFYVGGTAYLVPNLLGQAGFLALHQGLGALPNLLHSTRTIRGVGKGPARASFRAALRAIGGTGVTRAIMEGSGPVGAFYRLNQAIGERYAKILDDAWRENAVLYEARLRGYDTARAVTRLAEAAKRDPAGSEAGVVREIHEAVNEHYGAFDKLSEFERNTLTQLVFIYPWLRASFEYALKLPVNHPVKAVALEVGGSYANRNARADFIDIFRGQGLSAQEAAAAADQLMGGMPGVFALGGQAVSPLAVALLSTPSELLGTASPFLRGDWKEGFLSMLDVGTPAVAVFESGMRALFDQFSQGLGPEIEENLGSFARDYTLYKRLVEGGTAWFEYTPGQALGGRLAGSFYPRGVRGEGLLESAQLDAERSGQTLGGQEEGFAQVESRRTTTRASRQAGQRVRNTAGRDIDRWPHLAAANNLSAEEIETGEAALNDWQDFQLALLPARVVPRWESGRTSPRYRGVEPLTGSKVGWPFRDRTYETQAEIAAEFMKDRLPETARDVDEAFEQFAQTGDYQGFYETVRDRLSELLHWGRVRSLMGEWGEG